MATAVVYRPGMRLQVRDLFYSLFYAIACGGLVYCCASCLWRLTEVPTGSKTLFVVMVFFGGYGAYLCGQTSVEILQGARRVDEEEPADETTAQTTGLAEVSAAVVSTAIDNTSP
ncbi:MAG: hypothetical protein VX311_13830 [Planctomycetota bacterium]|nr:hypothetical protein [Planctomycetota bacterium]